MRSPATLALVLCGLGLFAIAALALAPEPDATPAPSRTKPAPRAAIAPTAQGSEGSTTKTVKLPPVRSIAPGIATVPAFQSRQLDRQHPRLPRRREAAAGGERHDGPDRSLPHVMRFYRPVADAAGSFKAGGRTVHVQGVQPVAVDKVCEAADGTTWPCGMRARTAFRAWLRGRAVDCKVGPKPGAGVLSAPCALNGRDVGEWLVSNGWAVAAKDGPYAQAGKQAGRERLGLFGDGPAMR